MNILTNIVQKYYMQQCITRMPVPIVPTEKGTWSMHTDNYSAENSCHLHECKQKLSIVIMLTKVVICNCCIQKLSFAIVACKSYRSFDTILRFFELWKKLQLQFWLSIVQLIVQFSSNFASGRLAFIIVLCNK